MATREQTAAALAAVYDRVRAQLDERQRRLLLGAGAQVLGHGGIRAVAQAAGAREGTVARGLRELERGEALSGRVRRPGGGRKRADVLDPGLRSALLALVEPDVRGDPMSPLRWTTKSTRKLAEELTGQGHRVSADTVGDLLREEGFSLQANAKTLEGTQHPDRDAQFQYINEQARAHRDTTQPVISVDTKKKELVGQYRNAGREWTPSGAPVEVNTHDFLDRRAGKAIPYGIYDTATNTGWAGVGTDHDTAAFAVASIRRWWQAQGQRSYPKATRLLITADAGGAGGYRTRAWKTELAALAAETGLTITVCHLPPGTSKWNKVEHRLFAHISMNWRGRPLTSHDVIINSMAATTTRTGLRVHAEVDPGSYPTGVKIGDAQVDALPMSRHRFHGDWNYTLHPAGADQQQPTTAPVPPAARQAAPQPPGPATLRDPQLTGMSRRRLDTLTSELTVPLAQQREHNRQQRRGSQRRRAAGAGAKDALAPADRILATILYLRKLGTQDFLAELFGVARSTLTRAVQEVQPLLAERGHTIPPSTARFRTPADVTAFLAPGPAHPTSKPTR